MKTKSAHRIKHEKRQTAIVVIYWGQDRIRIRLQLLYVSSRTSAASLDLACLLGVVWRALALTYGSQLGAKNANRWPRTRKRATQSMNTNTAHLRVILRKS
jgi:hypothetical protein